MKTLQGIYNSCIIYTDNITAGTAGQLTALLNQESCAGSKIRIMPDCHEGAGCVIGSTMTIRDKVIPNLVGVDIGCGMLVIRLKEKRVELPKLDSVIHKSVPAGFSVRSSVHKYLDRTRIDELLCPMGKEERITRSLGTLGGGNHFIELDRDDEGTLYLVIHSGSRNLGVQVASYYQEEAWKRLRESGRDTAESVPHELAYCEGELFNDYLHDMLITQEYAYYNRLAIAETILDGMKLHERESFESVHNYIDTESMILRKGACSAKEGERLIIPINMRDGSLLCSGKGNPEWNCSAPHGAGRLMSRTEAKQSFTVSEFKKQMEGIYSTTVSRETLDESPMAYKPMDEIIENIGDTVEIDRIIRPVYNFKAAE
ncbi:MAG: RtcB family protein [Lachnospiraceae bacterium]|nr:RtcB family protein [Lachnospiraceae bacterium]